MIVNKIGVFGCILAFFPLNVFLSSYVVNKNKTHNKILTWGDLGRDYFVSRVSPLNCGRKCIFVSPQWLNYIYVNKGEETFLPVRNPLGDRSRQFVSYQVQGPVNSAKLLNQHLAVRGGWTSRMWANHGTGVCACVFAANMAVAGRW